MNKIFEELLIDREKIMKSVEYKLSFDRDKAIFLEGFDVAVNIVIKQLKLKALTSQEKKE